MLKLDHKSLSFDRTIQPDAAEYLGRSENGNGGAVGIFRIVDALPIGNGRAELFGFAVELRYIFIKRFQTFFPTQRILTLVGERLADGRINAETRSGRRTEHLFQLACFKESG